MPAKKAAPARPLEAMYERALDKLDQAQVKLLRAAVVALPELQGFKAASPLGALGRAVPTFLDAEDACDSCAPDHAGRAAR